MEVIFEIEDIVRGYEDPKTKNNKNQK